MADATVESPKIVSLDGPDQVVAGAEITLSWQLAGGAPTELLLNDKPVEGSSCTVKVVDDPTWFTLTSTNAGGRAVRRKVVGTNRADQYVSGFAHLDSGDVEKMSNASIVHGPVDTPVRKSKQWNGGTKEWTWDAGDLRIKGTTSLSITFDAGPMGVSFDGKSFSVEAAGISVDLSGPKPLRGQSPAVTGAEAKVFEMSHEGINSDTSYSLEDGYVGANHTVTWTLRRVEDPGGSKGFTAVATLTGFLGFKLRKPDSGPWYVRVPVPKHITAMVETGVFVWNSSTVLETFGSLASAAAAGVAANPEVAVVVLA